MPTAVQRIRTRTHTTNLNAPNAIGKDAPIACLWVADVLAQNVKIVNKAQAKKLACRLGGGAIDQHLCAGWPFTMINDEDCEWSEADQKRIADALNEVVTELYTRGGKFDELDEIS